MSTPLAVQKILAEAIKTIGMSDENNTVRTPIHLWYNAKFGNPDPSKYAWDWCDGAVTYWAWMSGNQGPVVFGGAYAYTVDHANAFKARGQWHTDVAGIAPGDIVFFDWDGSNSIGEIDHVGIVEYVNGAEVHTIEGNIENAVRRKVRTAATIVGYGRPAYVADSGTTPPPGPAVQVRLADAQAHEAAATRVIQDALNREFGGVAVDGDYGPQTTAAYTRWQQSLGWPGDGEPGAHSLWSLARKYEFTTDITGTPAGPGGSTPPPPPPTPEPEPEVPVVYLEDTGPNGTTAANKVVQTALNKWHPSSPLLVDGIFGPVTKARYTLWQNECGFTGAAADGVPGISSLTSLGKRPAYRFDVKRRTTTTPPPPPPATLPEEADYLTVPEPAHNYSRVSYGGKTVNVRTREMLKLAAKWAGVTITLTQGSYNTGVAASAGTHDGGGVVDINVNAWSSATRARVQLALRKAGFAAWLRTPADGFAYHIHACAIGDREMASLAKSQVQSYFNGRNGLANNGADNSEHRWPNWADKYNQ